MSAIWKGFRSMTDRKQKRGKFEEIHKNLQKFTICSHFGLKKFKISRDFWLVFAIILIRCRSYYYQEQ